MKADVILLLMYVWHVSRELEKSLMDVMNLIEMKSQVFDFYNHSNAF